jgi:hypothetical protein
MGFVDSLAGQAFRSGDNGRVVVFPAGGARAYRVGSEAEERRIRSFLRMYFYALLAIQVLGTLAAYGWWDILGGLGHGASARDLLRIGILMLVAYGLCVALPLILLSRSLRRDLTSFVSESDAVPVPPAAPSAARRMLLAMLVFGLVLVLGVVFFLVSRAH